MGQLLHRPPSNNCWLRHSGEGRRQWDETLYIKHAREGLLCQGQGLKVYTIYALRLRFGYSRFSPMPRYQLYIIITIIITLSLRMFIINHICIS